MVESVAVAGVTLFFDESERDAGLLIRDGCARSVQVIRECWGLEPPAGCTVHVMTSWVGFAFKSAPWHRRILLAVFFPLWCFRVMRIWKAAGGWVQGYGRSPAVGIKPPRMLAGADRSVGDKLFIRDVDVAGEVGQVTCHELTHAFTNHLRLPTWLHEGIAMVSVDRMRGKPSVRSDTLDLIEKQSCGKSPSGYPRRSLRDANTWIYLYARGYWLTRYLVETKPQLVPAFFDKRRSQAELECQVAAAFGKGHDEFWASIDRVLVDHFKAAGG